MELITVQRMKIAFLFRADFSAFAKKDFNYQASYVRNDDTIIKKIGF